MTERPGDSAALAALARAFRRGWPARMVDKAAPGWSELLLAALRAEPNAPAAVAAALVDEAALARAISDAAKRGVDGDDPVVLAQAILQALTPDS